MKSTIIFKRAPGVTVSILVALAFGGWSILLGQDRNWDLLNYHLYNPYAFLNDRIEFDLAPAGVQTFFSPVLDIVYFTAITHLSPRTVAFLIGVLQGLNFFLIYKIAARVIKDQERSEIHSLLLALAGVLTVGFLAEVGSTMHDSLVALFPLASLWMVMIAIDAMRQLKQDNQQPLWALIIGAGFIAGTGVGLKLVSAIYALPLCLSLLVLPLPFLNRVKFSVIFGLSVLTGLFVTGGYWLYEVWRLFGNPLFPQFNNYFQGELAALDETRDLRFLPRTLFDKIFYPVIFTLDPHRAAELRYQQYSWLVAYIAVIALLADRIIRSIRTTTGRRQWNTESSYLLAFFCTSYILWLNIFGIYRYLIVIELLIPLLLFIIFSYLFNKRSMALAALIFIGALTAVNLRGVPDWGHSDWADSVYRIEPGALPAKAAPAAIYLAGQPLAWIIPALDLQTPFIQLVPNMSVSEAYWQRAKILVADRIGKSFVIYESNDPVIADRAHTALEKLGLSVDNANCGQISAFLGAARSQYRYCELRNTESN